MRILLISTYELGHQPFGLALPAAFLRRAGHEVETIDTTVQCLPGDALARADAVGFHLAMHTATRMAAPLIARARATRDGARIACFGLYAPINAAYLRELGADAIFGGESEEALVRWLDGAGGPMQLVTLERLQFPMPDRSTLPPPDRYARLVIGGEQRTAGHTEASRGCKHRCRHCPVVPVYEGHFRILPAETVLADVEAQVRAGARHITFGDPDFFNGPAHARRIVEPFAARFPGVTYDVTIKIEHLLEHRDLLPVLAGTGCAFVTSAVESIDDRVLALLEKGHTRADFLDAVRLCRAAGLALAPTFIPFTPWATIAGYRELLRLLAGEGLAGAVAPIQLALRLLITNGSRLLELEDIRAAVTGWDAAALTHRWRHADPAVDALADTLLALVAREQQRGASRAAIFAATADAAGVELDRTTLEGAAVPPYLTEPWYCCAEPAPPL